MMRLLIACTIVGLAGLSWLPAWAEEPDPAAEVAEIMAGVEGLVTQLALAEDLNTAEVEALRKSLAELHRQLEGLSVMLANLEVGPPPLDPTQWRAYDDYVLALDPPDAKFAGWNLDSGIDLGWGEYGEVKLDVQNSAYRAQWTIRNAYRGEVKASVEAGSGGDIMLTITDPDGTREFRIENGGIGPISTRAGTPAAEAAAQDAAAPEPSEITTEPEAADADPAWAAEYRATVASGQLAASPTMEWFINQTKSRVYETDALRNLGEAVLELSGQPRWDAPLGVMAYYVNDERKEMLIPDPRSYPEGFSHVVNKMYILALSEQLCVVEIY